MIASDLYRVYTQIMDYTNPKNCLTFKAQRVARTMGRQMEMALKPVGLTNQQFATFTILNSMESVTVSELAEMMGVERTTMTRNIEQMRKKNWIEQVPTKDQRIRAYEITRSGKDLYGKAVPLWQAQQAVFIDTLGDEAVVGLVKLSAGL